MAAFDVGEVLPLPSPLLLLNSVLVDVMHIHDRSDAKSKALLRQFGIAVRVAVSLDQAWDKGMARPGDDGKIVVVVNAQAGTDFLDDAISYHHTGTVPYLVPVKETNVVDDERVHDQSPGASLFYEDRASWFLGVQWTDKYRVF